MGEGRRKHTKRGWGEKGEIERKRVCVVWEVNEKASQ